MWVGFVSLGGRLGRGGERRGGLEGPTQFTDRRNKAIITGLRPGAGKGYTLPPAPAMPGFSIGGECGTTLIAFI